MYIIRYNNKKANKVFFIRRVDTFKGDLTMKGRSMAKVKTVKCGVSHTDKPAGDIIRKNELGIPVICGGGKTMREMYRETR